MRGRIAVVALGVALVTALVPAGVQGATGQTRTVCPSDCTYASIQDAIDDANRGDEIRVLAGTYGESLHVDTPDLAIVGEDRANVTVDARGFSNTRGITAQASGFTLRNLTVLGPDDGDTSNTDYGVKVETPDGEDLGEIALERLAVEGSGRSEVDLHGVDGAEIDDLVLRGQGTAGNGLALTDSHNVDVYGLSTSDNAWGGVAFYTSGAFTGEAGTSNVTLQAYDDFDETNPVYLQGDPGTFADVETPGFPVHLEYLNNPQFTFRQPGVQAALDAAVTISLDDRFDLSTGSIEDTRDGSHHANPGMSLQLAVDQAEDGDVVAAHGGPFEEQIVIEKSIQLEGRGLLPTIAAPENLEDTANGRAHLVTVLGEDTDAEIRELRIRGPATGLAGGVTVTDGAYVAVRDSSIVGIRDDPLAGAQRGVGVGVGRLWQDTSTEAHGSALVEDTEIGDFQKSAVVATGAASTLTLRDSHLECTGDRADDTIAQDAVQVWQGARARIVGNHVEDCVSEIDGTPRGTSIHLSGGVHDTLVAGNLLEDGEAGIALMNFGFGPASAGVAEDLRIEDNTVENHAGGVYLAGAADDVVVSDNDLSRNSVFGIFLGPDTWIDAPQGFTDVRILDNDVRRNPSPGVLVRDSAANATVQFNEIEDNDVGLLNLDDDAVDATHNWWGAEAGPSADANPLNGTAPTGESVRGPAEVTPWCLIPSCTANLAAHSLSPHPTGPDAPGT